MFAPSADALARSVVQSHFVPSSTRSPHPWRRLLDVTSGRLFAVVTLIGAAGACSGSPDDVLAEIAAKAEQNENAKTAEEKAAAEQAAAEKAAAEKAAAEKAAAEKAAAEKAAAEKAAAEKAADADDPPAADSGGSSSNGSSSNNNKKKEPSGPKVIPEKRSDADFHSSLKKVKAGSKCNKHASEPIEARVTVVVEADGSVQHTRAKPPVHGTPLGDCLESTLKDARFNPAQKLQMHWHTFKFPVEAAAAPKKKPSGPPASEGKPIYMKKCKSCHGADGNAKTSMGEKLNIQPLKKTPNGKIKGIITNGVAGTKMKAFKGKLTDHEIAAVTSFVKSL